MIDRTDFDFYINIVNAENELIDILVDAKLLTDFAVIAATHSAGVDKWNTIRNAWITGRNNFQAKVSEDIRYQAMITEIEQNLTYAATLLETLVLRIDPETTLSSTILSYLEGIGLGGRDNGDGGLDLGRLATIGVIGIVFFFGISWLTR